ncbi:MAG: NAD(P)H-dependent oxidoreductase subunit E [bacterium]|nr:NAD(P)H-dependent oxidoreductase subunit E [bacterium]
MELEKKQKVIEVIDKHKKEKGSLITIFQEIQEIIGYLQEDIFPLISERINIPLSEIFGVATFYADFYLTPHGKYTIKACKGTACSVKGSKKVISAIKNATGIKEGETTQDYLFSFQTVSCLGACALSPVMIVNKDYFGKMTPDKVETILSQYNTNNNRKENDN